MKRSPLLALSAIVVASCSTSSSDTGTDTTPPSATAATTIAATTAVAVTTTMSTTTTTIAETTTTLDPMEGARLEYFGVSSDSNTVFFDIQNRYGPTISQSEVKAWCAESAANDEEFARRISAYDWPDEVQDEADALVKAVAASAGIEYSCANAATNSEAYNVFATIAGSGNEASAIRLALGLPIDRG